MTLPDVDDDDLAWVCKVMGLPSDAFSGSNGQDPRLGVIRNLKSLDVEACPGSGKTTLLVAKLAILARKWRFRGRGICVISHTNTARREIEEKLAATSAGSDLLRYPHFIGTIHSFVNEYFALPWLRSRKHPLKAIDSEITLRLRWSQIPRNYRNYLDKQHYSWEPLIKSSFRRKPEPRNV